MTTSPLLRRTSLVTIVLALMFGGLLARGAWLAQSSEPGSLESSANPAQADFWRAPIIDRNGETLVRSGFRESLAADPRLIWDAEQATDQLLTVFPELHRETILGRLSSDLHYVWVKRGLTEADKDAVLALELEGLIFEEERGRLYAHEGLAGHALGYVGIDETGLAGLEYRFDQRLKTDPEPLRLTLDAGIQYAVEAELEQAARDFDLIGASGIVLDAHTGAIRAMASWPQLDPSAPVAATHPAALDRNIGAVYELGSIYKPLIIAAAIEAGSAHESDRFDFRTPLIIQNVEISDIHPIPGPISLSQVVSESSNKGTVEVARAMGADAQLALFEQARFFERSPIELSGSEAPLLPPEWDELSLATSSYGHAMSITPLVFATAFSAFANDGEIIMPTLLEETLGTQPTHRLFSPETVQRTNRMLRETVLNGTGTRASVPGYRVAGKTGTAEKPIDGVYAEDRNITSFAAIFPADRPQYVVLIVLDEAQQGSAGGVTAAWNAAPTTGRVIERIAPHLGVMPVFADASSQLEPQSDAAAQRSALQ